MDPQAIAVKPCSVPLPSHYCHCSPQLAVTCSHCRHPAGQILHHFLVCTMRGLRRRIFSALLCQNFVILVERLSGIERLCTYRLMGSSDK